MAEILVVAAQPVGAWQQHDLVPPDRATEAIAAGDSDLIVLDLDAPGAVELLSELGSRAPGHMLPPVLAVTTDRRPFALRRALTLGARDVQRGPIDSEELVLRAHNLIRAHALELRLRGENRRLRRLLAARADELRRLRGHG